eukprot:1011007-Karenia_brevis.AAC.1
MLRADGYNGEWPPGRSQINHLRNELRKDLQLSDEEKMKEAQHVDGIPEYESLRKKQQFSAKVARHNPKRRRLGINMVKNEHGEVIRERSEANKYLGRFWG